MDPDNFTVDSIWIPEVRIRQSRRGYRFALDAVLLAHFIKLQPHEEALEIGCGNGIIIVLLSHLQRFRKITGVEIQHELAKLAGENVRRNNIQNAGILEADVREVKQMLSPKSFDLIYSNPPYRKAGSGKLNPSGEKAVARHEIKMKLEDLFDTAEYLLHPDGRLTVILPQFREHDFIRLSKKHGFKITEKRYIHSLENEPPVFFLTTVTKRPAKAVLHKPLVIYKTPGQYTEEIDNLLTRKRSITDS